LTPPPSPTTTLSLHDALPICRDRSDARVARIPVPHRARPSRRRAWTGVSHQRRRARVAPLLLLVEHDSRRGAARSGRTRQTERRSEEHTSELQSLAYLVCRLL